MKKFAALMLLLSLGVFTIGCEKPPAPKPTGKTPEATKTEPAATTPAPAKTAEPAKETGEKK